MADPLSKVWEGRLGARTARAVEEYTSSVADDRHLWAVDVDGSLAHARMLRGAGLLNANDHRAITKGLRAIRDELSSGSFAFSPQDEDIHTAIERRLFEVAGPVAGKLHTGRSRNDQVATDVRLWAMRACSELTLAIAMLQQTLLTRAREHRQTLLPGYTHLQRAQVVTLAHHLLAYIEMLQRDIDRLFDARRRCDVMPLGSGALAASTLPLDRERTRAELGFDAITSNSIDAVADRDFAVEITAACALLMVHASRLGEELVLWSSSEFGFVELPATHATGSSLMPQKKNPDVAELARGRSGRVIGDLVSLLVMLKGLPLAYNRDLQEDKRALSDAVGTALESVRIMDSLLRVVTFNVAAMRAAASDPMLRATDVAEHLVRRGAPFREAHAAVGQVVATALREGRSLADVSTAEWSAASKYADAGVSALFNVDDAVVKRDLPGGPGPRSVAAQLRRAAGLIARTRRLS